MVNHVIVFFRLWEIDVVAEKAPTLKVLYNKKELNIVPEKIPTPYLIKITDPLRMPYTKESVGYFSGSVGYNSGIGMIYRFPV